LWLDDKHEFMSFHGSMWLNIDLVRSAVDYTMIKRDTNA